MPFDAKRRAIKILVSGGWGYGNRGDNAILKGMLQLVGEYAERYDVAITSYDCGEIARNHMIESEPSIHRLLQSDGRLQKMLRGIHVRYHLRRGSRVPKFLEGFVRAIDEADLVVMAGGGYFNESWKDMMRAQYLLIRLVKSRGKPIVILGQTLGQFSKREIAQGLREHLALVDFVSVRDTQSHEIAAAAGVGPDRLVLTADFANLLPPPAPSNGRAAGPKIVGLMTQMFRPHEGKSERSAKGRLDAGSYLTELAQVTINVAAKRDVRFRVIPSTTWDEPFQADLTKLMRAHGLDVEVISKPIVDDYIVACQTVDVMLSTNMHPAIIASTNDIPSVALSYNFKLDDFMRDVGLDRYLHRIDDFDVERVSGDIVEIIDRSMAADPIPLSTGHLRDRARLNQGVLARFA